MDENTHLTCRETGKLLGYTVQHTRRLVREGKISALRPGRDWLIERTSAERFLRQRNSEQLRTTEDNVNAG